VVAHPGKQTFSTQTLAVPALLLPQVALVVHGATHDVPLHVAPVCVQSAFEAHGSPMRPEGGVASLCAPESPPPPSVAAPESPEPASPTA
jgi:hypothetical protein